ncbi:hypothetical protein NP493_316g01006 [Ridgeia piscesae]|uniref:Uncharacterized protein n=1 Tax=Ridgeia piscesae TaxID=27915 RepID=A0AAD9L687_RIDPI|nr:hypothetical protein NP493_316g01006 [Ridgeia piscesae]
MCSLLSFKLNMGLICYEFKLLKAAKSAT